MILKEQENKKVYSDGETTEQLMLDIARQYPEDAAEEYIADSSSYTLNNTFSSVRKNILNWYPFRENTDILEVGAGMGALTGLLCDKAKHVTAIEMSEARAEVIKVRYKNRNNLEVISEDINHWNTDKRFDYIIFIGVLEYAAIFSEDSHPYDEFLRNVRHLLKDDGVLLFAIENRFGLKYWLGSAEDHLQEPFVGIEGYPAGKTARTFSKKELSTILDRVGLRNKRFYGVLPDYKFPELIFAEEYTPDYMNLKKVSFTYPKNSMLYANEKELYKDIISNDVFPFFVNSFLVEASVAALSERHVVHVSAKGEVHKKYRVSTVIDSEDNVYKIPVHPDACEHIAATADNMSYLAAKGISMIPFTVTQNIICSKKKQGTSAQEIFQNALEKDDLKFIEQMIDQLRECLRKSSDFVDSNDNIIVENGLATEKKDFGPILKKAFIDMTFYNAFWENNELVFFDQEWCFEKVPLQFCLYYSIKSAYTKADVTTNLSLEQILKYAGVPRENWPFYDKLEEFVWSKILYRQTDFYGAEGYCNRYSTENTLKYKVNFLKNIISQKESEYESVKKALNIKESECEDIQKTLDTKNAEYEEKYAEYEEKYAEYEEKYAQFKNTIAQKEQTIFNKEQAIRNKEGHIEQLLEVEREYEREKHSRTYRLALKFRRISLWFFPVNSKRRFFAKAILKGLSHPRLMCKMINPKRIRNAAIILKTEGVESAEHHYQLVEEYEKSRSVPLNNEALTVEEVSQKELNFEDYVPLSFPQWDNPQVSIVIPVYNQFDYTWHCLESILNNSEDCTYEVIIANDCSIDLTTRLEEIVSGVHMITNQKNLRFLLNCNHAAESAKGEYILFLNNDTQVQPGWLKPLISLMEKDSSVGMVGSKLLYPDGYLQEAGGILWKDGSAWNYGNRQNPEDSEFNYVHETDYISGAAIMIRSSLWKKIGGFDQRFVPAYCEDSDLAFEVRRHGYKVMYQPKSVVVHFEGISNGTDLASGQKKYQVDNQQKFLEKWKNELEKNHFENGTNVFLARERSRNRKHVLVIDHYVPQYDKDAGSKTTFMYLKMLVKKGYQVTFLGDNFYPHQPYTSVLQQMGIFVLYGPKYAENCKEWLIENLPYFDVVYLNRPHITIKYIDLIKEHARGRIIYYGHDLHFLRIHREYELNGDKKLLEESDKWKEQELYIMRKADMNYYPSEVECTEIHKIDPNVPVKAITAYVYDQFQDIVYTPEERKGLLFVGGFGHTPNLDAVQWFLDKIYPEVYRMTKAPFYLVGSNAPKEITELTTEGVVVKGFVSEEELQQLYSSCRMVVVPLRYGAGVKGKVVEALYYGIPIVTTSVGAEGIEGVEDIVAVEDDEKALVQTITKLYSDDATLQEMHSKSKKYIRDHFSTEAAWSVIAKDFNY